MPASSNASTIRPRNAGPEPDSAVAASNCRSSSGTTSPSSAEDAEHRLLGRRVDEPARTSTRACPRPTCTPTFGMNRNTGASTSRIVSSVAVRTPAATDAIALRGVIRSETSRSTRSTSIGLTHRTTTSAAARPARALRGDVAHAVALRQRGRPAGAAVGDERCAPAIPGSARDPARAPSRRPCCRRRSGRALVSSRSSSPVAYRVTAPRAGRGARSTRGCAGSCRCERRARPC